MAQQKQKQFKRTNTSANKTQSVSAKSGVAQQNQVVRSNPTVPAKTGIGRQATREIVQRQIRSDALNKLQNVLADGRVNGAVGAPRTLSYQNDPNADKYIRESFNRGNPLTKVSGGPSSNARNDGMPAWASDTVRSQTITDYLNERAKNFTTSVEDFITGYKNPYREQIKDVDQEALAYMSPEQQQEYSYLLGKDSFNGTQTAKEFADRVKTENVRREALRRFQDVKKSGGIGRVGLDAAYSYAAGLDNSIRGMGQRFGNYITGKDKVTDPSAWEQTYAMMANDASQNGKKILGHTPEEILQGIFYMQGAMAPSQLAGGAAGLAMTPGKITAAVGAGAMFPQVAGNTYNETLRDTGDVRKARLYATMSGLNEAGGEYLLGGLENVSGDFVQDWVTKNLAGRLAQAEGATLTANASRALAKALANPVSEFVFNGAQEGFEEIVQGTVDTVLRNAILNENNEVNPFSEDNLYSAMVAALSVYGSNFAPSVAGNVQRSWTGNQYIEGLNDLGYDYQKLAESIPDQESDFTSEHGLVDRTKLQNAQNAKALAESLANKKNAGVRIKGSENADLAEAIENVKGDIAEHIGNRFKAQELEYAPMRDEEIRNNIRGGFDENGQKAFDALSEEDAVTKARPFAAYYNNGRFGTEVSERMEELGKEVGLTSDEISAAVRAGAADANKLFPTQESIHLKQTTDGIKTKGRQGKVKYQGIKYGDLTTQQKMRADFTSAFLNKGLGMDVVFVRSSVVDGKYQGLNGAFEVVNGRPTITIDVNAGMNAETDWTGQMSDIKTLLPVVSHELTHYLETANSEAYHQIAQEVINTLQTSGKYSKGLTFNEILNEERIRLEQTEGRQRTNTDAMHEIVARACEDMLSGNKEAMEAFEKMKPATRKTIADHIKDIFDNIRDFFEQMLKGYRSDSSEAKAIRSNMEKFEKIRDMWNQAINDSLSIVQADDVQAADTSDGMQAAFSIRQFAQSLDYDLLINKDGLPFQIIDPVTQQPITHVTEEHMRQTPMGVLVNAALANGTIDSKTASKQLKMFTDLMNLTLEYDDTSLPMVWEIAGTYLFSSVKTNSDAQYSTTVDYGTICSKTQALIDVLSNTMVQKGRGLTREEVMTAYNRTARQGLSVPCPVCYVFSRWMGVPSLLETMRNCQERFGNASKAEIDSYIKSMVKEYGDAKAINSEKTKVQNRMATLERKLQKASADKDTAEEKKIAKETQELQQKLTDLESFNWVTQVRCKSDGKGGFIPDPAYKSVPNDILLDLRKSGDFASKYPKAWKYRTTRGAGMGKAIMPYSGASIGDFIKGNKDRWSDSKNPFTTKNVKSAKSAVARAVIRAKAQNLIGGQRFQSTSDYRAEWGIDYLMTFLECQAAGSQVQLYTKVIEAVDMLASAGAECNLSIMPKDNGYIELANGKKQLVFSDVTGINFDEAYKKTTQYDNVQMILVGINDEHIRLAMADDRITFIIPWHSSGNSKDTLAQLMESVGETLDVAQNVDYSDTQTDKVIDNSPHMQRLRQFRKEILQGKLWDNYSKRQAKALTAEQNQLLDENAYLKELYRRFYQDESAQEYGVKLNGKQVSSIFPYEYWDKSLTIKDADQNGRRFQDYCASLGIQPRFSQFADDHGYWKLLIDRKMYNVDGTYHTPEAINVTNVKVEQIPMAVNSNNYKDMDKIAQATRDTLMALDGVRNDLQAVDTEDEFDSIEEDAVTEADESVSEESNPAYTGEYSSGKQFQHRVTESETVPGTNENLLDFLNKQIEDGDYITTYKAFLRIDDADGNPTYYSPMASLEKDENGKYTKLRSGIKIEQWLASDGKLTEEDIAKMKMHAAKPGSPWETYGNYKLKKADEYGNPIGDVDAAYNPYQHSSDQVLNDQFESAYKRPNIVVVECRIPKSEINNPYWARYAKDPTGMHDWKTGPIAGQLKETVRHVYMTRWILPIRELPSSEVAQRIYDVISKEKTQPKMYWNNLNPSVMAELEKMGVEIEGLGSPNYLKDTGNIRFDRYNNPIPLETLAKRWKNPPKYADKYNEAYRKATTPNVESAADDSSNDNVIRQGSGNDIQYSIRTEDGDVYRGITISDADYAYSEDIKNGLKLGETRDHEVRFLENVYKTGERIALIRSGVGNFKAYATTKIGKPEFISESEWESRRADTRVPKGSTYDQMGVINGKRGKKYYPFVDLKVLDEEVTPTSHSPVIARFDAEYSTRSGDDWLEHFSLSDLISELVDNQDVNVEPTKKSRAERRVDRAKKKLAELGLSFNGTKTLGWTDERIDTYLDGHHFASTNPNYAQAYITFISPNEFLDLTVGSSENTVSRLNEETSGMGDVDTSKLDRDYLQPMFLKISDEKTSRANVSGHGGRHRMILLGRAGFDRVPVLVFNSSNKYDKHAKAVMSLKPENQIGGFISRTREVTLHDLIPFSSGNKSLIKERYGPSATDEQYSQRGVDLDQRLDDLIQTYGALPKGEMAVNDISVPQQTSNGKRVRRYARTVLESGVTSDMINDEIKEKILKEGLSYEPVTDKSAAEYAASVLRIGGVTLAQKEWDKARRSDTFNKDHMAVGQELLREYAKQGDVENVINMVTELAAEGTRMGQNIQAMRMLKKYATQAPAVGLGYIQRTVDIMNREAKKKMGKRYKEMKIDQQLADAYINASTKDEIDAALAKIYINLGSQVQKTAGEEVIDRLRTWRYMSMLGNPRTHVRNLVGNALFVPAVTMKNVIGATIESTFRTKERTKSLITSKAARQFAAQDAIEMQDILQGNADKSIKQRIMDERKTFTLKPVNVFSKLNGDALEAEDWVFLRYHYQNALAQYITANKLNPNAIDGEDLAKARQYAVKEAQKATYRDANKVSTWLNQSKGAGAVVKYMMEGMMPFKKTPTNILRRGIEYSPAMIVGSLTKGIYDLNHGNITVNEWIDGLSSGLTGTAIFGLGLFLASTGAILGGYKDDDDKEKRKLKGEQEYAVKIGNHTYTIDWAAPGSLPLFVGVETMYALRQGRPVNMDDISKAAARLVDPMINMSMLSGLNDTLDAISYADDKLSTLASETFFNLLGQYVPTLFGQVARTMDTTQRVNYQDVNKGMPKNMLYFIEKMQNKIPYMTFSNDPYLDAFGRENTTESRFIAALQNFVSPGYIKEIDNDRVVRAVTKLQDRTEENVLPQKMPKYLGQGDDRMDLTSRQYYRFQKTAGTMSYNIIDSMLDDDRYLDLNADQQAEAIKMGYDYAKAAARLDLQPEYELKGSSKKIYEAYEENGTLPYDTILDLCMLKNATEGVTGDPDPNKDGKTIPGSEKKNMINAILESDGSAADKAKMYEMSYPEDELYKSWKKSNYSGVDYMKHYSKISTFKGDDKQEHVIDYIKSQTDDIEKQKLMFQIAGYKLDSEKKGVVTKDGNFNKKMGY